MTALTQSETASATELLQWAINTYGKQFAVVTSFQREGMVLLDMAVRISTDVRVITLDTGRLPDATYEMIETVRTRYGVRVEMVSPDRSEVERMVERFGPNLFRNEVAQRRLCCQIRKVRPLERKLEEFSAYAVGLRRGQSEKRSEVQKLKTDGGKVELSPLADWSSEQVRDYINTYDVPQHPLYAAGFTSIGCGPCTRATLPGENERAGRWWWEQDTLKECGLHFSLDGRAERKVDVLLRDILTHA